MDSGFVRGQSNNLPKVNMVMVLDFLANNPLYTSAEVRGVKLSTVARRGSRTFRKKRRSKIRMDCRVRRCRRRRACSGAAPPESYQPWSFIDSFTSFLILSCLIGLIYIMLENHCKTCTTNCDFNKSVADIAKNLDGVKQRYYELELKISQFSQEIPKLQGQIELIEAIASAIDKREGWNPRKCLPLPNVDVFLNNPPRGRSLGKNFTCDRTKCPKLLPAIATV